MIYANKKTLLLTFLLGLATLFFVSAHTFAQTSNNYDVTVSPVFFDLAANPGDTVSDKIRIRNNTSSPIPIKLEVKRLTGDLTGNLSLKQDKNDYTLSWIKFSQDSFIAKPLEWTEVTFTVNVPKDAAYGYYYTITFTQDNTNPLAKTGVSLTGAVGIPILLNVRKEGAKSDAKILEFSTKNFISEYLPADFIIKVENIGNVHIKPHGNIFINDGRSKDLAVLDINPGLGNIIPNSARIFTASWTDGFLVRQPVVEDGQVKLDKNGKPLETITINWNKLTSFRMGKYTANLLLVFDNGKRDVPLEATTTFWVFPWKALILIGISLIVIILLIRFLLRFYINREIRRRIKN